MRGETTRSLGFSVPVPIPAVSTSRVNRCCPRRPRACAPVPDAVVEVARRAADAAGSVTRRWFRSPALHVDTKADDSPVTQADREAEMVMRAVISDALPSHAVLGEEAAATGPDDAEYTWVLDPIDGTKSFVAGKPTFGTLIAVLQKGRPVYGLIDQPVARERWEGGVGRPTTLNGDAVRVRAPKKGEKVGDEELLKGTVAFATTPDMFAGVDGIAFKDLASSVRSVNYGCDCYAYALLASGHVDLVVEADLKVWDFAALEPVVTAAGGHMTTWEGGKLDMYSDGRVVASIGPQLHRAALAKLQCAVHNISDDMNSASSSESALPADPGVGHVESMTGFGEHEMVGPGDSIVSVQVRSVNSRYCDIQYRGPRALAPYESELTALIKRSLSRGKIVFSVGLGSLREDNSPGTDSETKASKTSRPTAMARNRIALEVDTDAVRTARSLLDKVAAAAGIESNPTMADILNFSEVLVKRDAASDMPDLLPVVRECVQKAVDSCMSTRRSEGAILERDLLARCAEILRVLAEVERRAPVRLERERGRLLSLLDTLSAEVATGKVQAGRLEQEIALVADRIDITEEITRLRAHVELFQLAFFGVGGPVGQRLLFLLQEMHRESSTIGSKACDAPIAQMAVFIKQEVEKIREQVMNLC